MFVTLLLCSTLTGYAKPPPNLGLLREKIIAYHDSGAYLKDITQKITQAETLLKQTAATNQQLPKPKKLAIVLDIDETSLSNYDFMVSLQFGGTKKELAKWDKRTHNPPIQPTLNLYRLAKINHIAVFFVTGRHESARRPTEKNLKSAGYQSWKGLFMKPNNYSKEASAAPYKAGIRQRITEHGYDIILNIGDQKSDLINGYADNTILLPNPFYYIP